MLQLLNTAEFTKFLKNEAASTKSVSSKGTTISLDIVDIIVVYVLQLTGQNSMSIQALIRKLENLNISSKKLSETQFYRKGSVDNHHGQRTEFPAVIPNTITTKDWAPANDFEEKTKNKSKHYRTKNNQIEPQEWNNIKDVKDGTQSLFQISFPAWMGNSYVTNNKESRGNVNTSFKSRNPRHVYFNTSEPNKMPIVPKQHSQCCTIL